MTIRVTPETGELVRRCAAHCGMGVSDVLRRTAAHVRRRGACNNSGNKECYTEEENGRFTETLRARGVELPAGVTAAEFRAVLSRRCAEALSRPSAREVRVNFLCMDGDGLTPQKEDRYA